MKTTKEEDVANGLERVCSGDLLLPVAGPGGVVLLVCVCLSLRSLARSPEKIARNYPSLPEEEKGSSLTLACATSSGGSFELCLRAARAPEPRASPLTRNASEAFTSGGVSSSSSSSAAQNGGQGIRGDLARARGAGEERRGR